ncbi:hypothetical protein B0H12DRAFT_701939 [Mycena haematopus]|nr:hypothetical protein B0H12DRAFT_701939 [Mycena haematopus]
MCDEPECLHPKYSAIVAAYPSFKYICHPASESAERAPRMRNALTKRDRIISDSNPEFVRVVHLTLFCHGRAPPTRKWSFGFGHRLAVSSRQLRANLVLSFLSSRLFAFFLIFPAFSAPVFFF